MAIADGAVVARRPARRRRVAHAGRRVARVRRARVVVIRD